MPFAPVLKLTAPAVGDGWYLNVVETASTQETQNLIENDLDYFKKALGEKKIWPFLNVSADDFTASFNDRAGHVFIACFNTDTKRYAPMSHCKVASVTIEKDKGTRLTSTGTIGNAHIQQEMLNFQTLGHAALMNKELVAALSLRHGDRLQVSFGSTDASPKPSFTSAYFDRFSLSGTAGFQIPIAAYGGVITEKGLSFSLLAPAFAWGGQVNFKDPSFSRFGFGALLAPSLVEAAVTEQSAGATGGKTSSFTLERLAFGAYLDLGGYVWLGGGARIDLSKAHEHAGLAFLVIGPDLLNKFMGK